MDHLLLQSVGRRIREIRKEKGLTQEQVGERGGFNYSYIGRIERGDKNVSLLTIEKIAEALDVEPMQFFIPFDGNLSMVTPKDQQIQETVQLLIEILRKTDTRKIEKIKRILKEFDDE